jgi:hypothetical protein
MNTIGNNNNANFTPPRNTNGREAFQKLMAQSRAVQNANNTPNIAPKPTINRNIDTQQAQTNAAPEPIINNAPRLNSKNENTNTPRKGMVLDIRV